MSHAWLDVGGRKIDLTLVHTDPDIGAVAGKVLILDRSVGTGADYSYFRQKERRHIEADEWASQSSANIRSVLSQKAKEHVQMTKCAGDAAEMRRFLDAAPDGIRYERLKEIVRERS